MRPDEQTTAAHAKHDAEHHSTGEGAAEVAVVGYVEQHWGDLGLGVVAAVLTIAIVEATKGWVKLWLAKKFGDAVTPALEETAVRTLAIVASVVPVLALDFRSAFARLTGHELDFGSALVVGVGCTWASAHIGYALVKEVRPVRAARVRLYRLMGVTQDEVDAARTTRAHRAVTQEDIDAHRRNGQE